MANPLLDALSGIGTVLDTPGSVVRGLLSGDANRAFSGIFDPSQRMSGRDMLNKWGVTDENSGIAGDVGGFVASLATDPLTWAGTGALGKLLGRGGEAAASVERAAIPKAATTTLLDAAPGVGGYEKLADGTIRRTAALPEVATQRIGALGEKLGGGPGALSEAEQWTGNRLSSGLPTMDNRLVPGVTSGDVSPLLNLRRDFSVAKGVGTDSNGLLKFDAVGGFNGPEDNISRARQIFDTVKQTASSAMDEATPLNGVYSPRNRLATILDGSNGTLRHETMHGLIDAANRSGDASGLSFLPRMSSKLQNANSPFLQALGQIGEEASAYGAEGRGFRNQLLNVLEFLDKPTAGYAAEFAKTSPLAAKLYSASAIPNAARIGAAGAAGTGAYLAFGGDQ